MPRVDRLSALDATFLALETPTAPMHVGWTMRFDGTPPSLPALRRHLEARLHLVPRFRRRVTRPLLGLGDPRWTDDPAFDVAHHVHAVRAPAPGGLAELREVAGTLLSQPLDPGRPLWRAYLVEGLASGGFAFVGQAHHALVDGIAAIEVALLLFGPDAQTMNGAPDAWRPERSPRSPASAADAAAVRGRQGAGYARSAARAVRRPPTPAHARAGADALASLLRATPGTSFDRTATHAREVAWASADLEGAKAAGKRHHATVNDVLLAACTLGLGEALRRRGEAPPTIKALIPVNTRGNDAAARLGNSISFLAVDLPVGEPDPVTVLRRVRDATRAEKARGTAGPLDAVARAADLLPPAGARTVAKAAMRAAQYSVIVSNVPGPPVELGLLGRPLRAINPCVPVPEGHSLTIGSISYDGRLHLGLTADAVVVPDVLDIARDVELAFDALALQAASAPTPWQARASARRRARRGAPSRA